MKPSVAAALIGLLVVLLPWLPSCPARIAAADLPPPLPRDSNFTGEGRSHESPSAAQPAGGASSNAVLVGGGEKIEARFLVVNEPSDPASNCTEGVENCRHTVPSEHPEDTTSNATHAALGSPTVVEKDDSVELSGDERHPEESPLPAGSEISSNDGHEVEGDSTPGINRIEDTSRIPDTPLSPDSRTNGTAASRPGSNSSSAVVQSDVSRQPPTSSPSTTTGRGFGSAIEGNHVFSSTPEGLGLPRVTANKMVAAGDPDEDFVGSKETSTPELTDKVTSTPELTDKVTSTPETTIIASVTEADKGRKVQKETKLKSKGREKGHEAREESVNGEAGDNDEEMEGEEDKEDDSWDSMGSAHEERVTSHDDLPQEYTTGGDGESLYYRQFTRMESQDFEEPGTTRSYIVVEKSTKLDYSYSSVTSEVYDSDSPHEDSTKDPSGVHEASETKHNESSATSSPLDTNEGHSVEEETSDSPEYIEEDKLEENMDAETSHTTTAAPDLKVSKDLDSASSVRGGETIARAQSSKVSGNTRSPSIPTSTEREPEATIPTRMSETTRKGNWIGKAGTKPNDASSQADVPSPTTMKSASMREPLKESSHRSGYATVHSTTSTTSSYTPRTSRRLNLLRSTTESPIKNEVTYNENVTGPTYDFKANISLTTPMVQLMLSTAPTTSTVAPETEMGGQITSASPNTSQTTDQALPEVLLVSTTVTTSSTEPSNATTEKVDVEDVQGGGNSINDWTTVGSSGNMASSREAESTTSSTTPSSGMEIYESATSNPISSGVTSSVLFTTVQNNNASDLVIESMSVNSTSEEVASVTASSSIVAASDGVSERVVTEISERFGSGNESSSVSPVSATFEPAQFADNVTTSSVTYSTSTGVTPAMEFDSSTSSDLHPYKVETKVPPVSLMNNADSSGSDSSSKEVGVNETFTVQPLSTPVKQSPTLPPAAIGSTPDASKDSSPTISLMPIVVKLNTSSILGVTDASLKTSTTLTGMTKGGEVSIITYPWHVRLRMKISWSEICHGKQQFSLKQALAQLISSAMISTSAHSVLSTERVLLLNYAESCPNVSGSPSEVHFCILSAVAESSSERGRALGEPEEGKGTTMVHCDATLMQLFLNIWDKTPKPMVEPLTHVKEVGIAHSSLDVDFQENPADDNTGVQAAIGISCIAAVALFLLAALLIIMRRRQRRFNYGQRCTPVSLDAYSLDSVSVREGSRLGRGQARNGDVGGRGMNGLSKGDGLNDWRASKRSYGNPAFEDDDGEEVLLSKPMNFATLTNAALDDDSALADEFRLIPKRFYKRTVRRKSRQRYKDPAGAMERGEAGGASSKDEEDDERIPEGAEEKNRYANVVPLTSTRVRLSAKPSGPLSTYINANFVRGPKNEERFYIACQAPLQSTIEDFWRMIWEQQSKVVLMLTNLVENSVEKCADYLPPSEVLDCHRLFGDFQVTLKKREVREKYIVSNLQLKNMESNLWREVTHLWFLGWPDQGVPEEPNQIIAFLIEARSFIKTNPGPTVVHCSPGTGRTGTVISIDICIREFEQSRMIDVPKVVQQLRRDREGAVQTQQQYAFIYKALSLYAAKLTGGAMDSF